MNRRTQDNKLRRWNSWDEVDKGISRKQKLAGSFDFKIRYMDDVLSLNNSKVGDFFYRIYLIELRIKDTTDTARSASCLDLHSEIDSDSR